MTGTIRREGLDHPIVMSEVDVPRVLGECVTNYNDARPYLSLALIRRASPESWLGRLAELASSERR